MRKIVQLALATQHPEFDQDNVRNKPQEVVTLALCDDGSSWLIRPEEHNAHWQRLPNIPQD